jgi:hypothetical protein
VAEGEASGEGLDLEASPATEPTLGELLTRSVRTTVPTRLYGALQLALPVAIDLASRGWWRAAGWAAAVAAFGAWGLADRWIARTQSDDSRATWSMHAARVGRAVAGAIAAGVAAVLALELFLILLGAAPGH